jgi:hypothetical protein
MFSEANRVLKIIIAAMKEKYDNNGSKETNCSQKQIGSVTEQITNGS